jgi:DNA-binding transcriptional ArsR family regulator
MSAELDYSPVQAPEPRHGAGGDANIAAVAALLADPARAAMLLALADGRALPAGELARHGRIAPSTASAHLGKLLASGYVGVESWGRHRYFRLTSRPLIEALEALALAAPPAPIRSLRQSQTAAAVRYARTCYDHLAGRVGVMLTEALAETGSLVEVEGGYQLTQAGKDRLHLLGVSYGGFERPAVFVPCHIDWSERRHHIAGPLAVALTRHLFEHEWIVRLPSSRAVRLTEAGRRSLRDAFGLHL